MDLKKRYPEKLLAADEAIGKIKRGSRIFIGTGCGEPQHLIHAMVKDATIQDLMV